MSKETSFEDLEEKLNAISQGRKPASEVLNMKKSIDVDGAYSPQKTSQEPVKKLYDLPDSTRPTESSVARYLPNEVVKGDSVVGGRAPDYSGYDELLKNIPRPRDTSTADLISMGLSTGIGMLTGQTGTAAKVAGKYGMDRFNKAEKRADSMEDMIMKLKLARATQMAKGAKGTTVKGGKPLDLSKYRYRDENQMLRTPQFVDERGLPVKDPTDHLYDVPTTQFRDIPTPDGGKKVLSQVGPNTQFQGHLMADGKVVEDANKVKSIVNTRTQTARPIEGLEGVNMQKTSANLTPLVYKEVGSIRDAALKDAQLNKIKTAHADIKLALEALPTATSENIVMIRKFLGMAMDKGRALTNEEFDHVANLDLGWSNRIEQFLKNGQEGEATNAVRKAYEKIAVGVEKQVRDLYNAKARQYNDRIKLAAGTEYRPDLDIGYEDGITAKSQMKGANYIEKKANELSAGTTFVETVTMPDGTKRKVKLMLNPVTGKKDFKGFAQ